MNINDIKKGIKMVQLAFSIQVDEDKAEDMAIYANLVLNRLEANGVTLQEFNKAIAHFIDTQDKNFKQMPTIAELLKFCNKQPRTSEELAKKQALIVFEETPLYDHKVIFDDPVTNYVIQYEFGGLSNLRYKYISSIGEGRPIAEGKRVFERAYITAHDNKKEKTTPLTTSETRDTDEIVMIGNKDKISNMLTYQPETNNNAKILIQDIAKKMKG